MKSSTTFRFLLYVLFILTPVVLSAQGKQANYWYFGAHAGLNYNTGSPPSALSDGKTWFPSVGFAGSASISDNEGNLLFYSDGETIWNRNHVVMQYGDDMGHVSTQGAMIVPYPGNNILYYFYLILFLYEIIIIFYKHLGYIPFHNY